MYSDSLPALSHILTPYVSYPQLRISSLTHTGHVGYDAALFGRVASGAVLSAWYTLALKVTLELSLFFFRNGLDELETLTTGSFAFQVGRIIAGLWYCIGILVFLAIVKVRYVVVLLKTYHALLFLPLYQAASFCTVAMVKPVSIILLVHTGHNK